MPNVLINKIPKKAIGCLKQKSWFTVSGQVPGHKIKQRISLKTSQFKKEDQPPLMISKSIKLYPGKTVYETKYKTKIIDQKQVLLQWFGVARLYYNYCIDLLNYEYYNSKIIKTKFRDEVKAALELKYPFSKDVPVDTRVGAIFDAFTAWETAKKKTEMPFSKTLHELKFRTKKDKSESIVIPKKTIGDQQFYVTYLGKMKSATPFNSAEHECRICYKNLNFYLQIPMQPNTENQGKFGNFVSLDPGVRTFMTAFSEQGIYEFGKGDISKISKLKFHLNTLKGSKKRKARVRISKRIQNLISEAHWKISNFLAKNFANIYIPAFNVKQMTSKKNRTLNKQTKRNMLSWSHYEFRMRLIHQARKYSANVWVTNESYTSKTCTNCGTINETLGGKKTFNCAHCHLSIGRDINGARNNMLRALVDSPL